MRFSERYGLKPIKKIIQKNGMDTDLRNKLWNALIIYYYEQIPIIEFDIKLDNSPYKNIFIKMWDEFFKLPVDRKDAEKDDDYEYIFDLFGGSIVINNWSDIKKYLRKYFFQCEWYEVYDFIEYFCKNFPDSSQTKNFISYCNDILEKELSAYRFVVCQITPITSEEEIITIEGALEVTDSLKPVNIHLNAALEKLSDRKSPDYRNSIKESISAVEAICNLITKSPKKTLGQCIKELKGELDMHPALKDAFSKLYGYTSDAEGIRHALMDESDLKFEDAKFMLVACSAFINYLVSKASRAGIDL